MATNKQNLANSMYAVIGIIILITLGTACEPKESPSPNLIFDIPISVTPEQEIYKVGDTIWIDINFQNVLTDTSGLYSVTFDDYNFNATLNILKLTNKNLNYAYQPGGFSYVQTVDKVGQIDIAGDSAAELIYTYDLGKYTLKSLIIVRHPGVYSMLFSTANSYYNPEFISSWKVNDQTINIGNFFYQVNKGGTRNTHLIFENTSSKWDESVWPNNVRLPFYTFKVVEAK